MTESSSIGLVLGAGGTAGAHWIRGVLNGLEERYGFKPEHASVLIGTSIGAIKAAAVGPHAEPPASVVQALEGAGTVPTRPAWHSSMLASARTLAGQSLAAVSRSGEFDPLGWVGAVNPNSRAQVCSTRRWPPDRRVASLTDSVDPHREIGASAAVPFGARHVMIDGTPHLDGAVWSVTNADLAAPHQLDVLVVIAPLVATTGGTLVSGLGRHQLAVELEPWRLASKPVFVLAPSSEHYASRNEFERHQSDAYQLVVSNAAAPTKPST